MADDLEIAAVMQMILDEERQPLIRLYNKNKNPFDELSDRAFIRLFRLNKQLTRQLINSLEEHLLPQTRQSSLPIPIKILAALRFLACGGYQVGVGNDIHLAISQSSVSRCVSEVCYAINNNLFNDWVHFPNDVNELNSVRMGFYRKYGFPGTIGALDCTHVAIFPPSINNEENIYVNRKGYHSINVQLICDSDLKIMNVNARYPGSTHDSFIWRNSNMKMAMEQLYNNNLKMWLIADSGYPLTPYLLTPILNVEPNTPEERYNIAHRLARNSIERCNGLLKSRFRCLLKHRVLHYAPEKASAIINACTVLHNMCINAHIENPEPEDDFDFGIIRNPNDNQNNDLLNAGRCNRQQIVNTYFT